MTERRTMLPTSDPASLLLCRRPMGLAAILVGVLTPMGLAQSNVGTGKLAELLTSGLGKDISASACVIDLQTGATVFEFRADEPMIPASTMKVFVMAAALELLGPDFAFQTTLYWDDTNLYLAGDGDPGLGDERIATARGETIYAPFERFAESLAAHGIRRVPGDLIYDAGVFDDVRIHPTWEAGDLGKWYAAPVAGLNFNDNCLDITVSPGGKPGEPALVSVVPITDGVRIINKCVTGGKGNPVLHHNATEGSYTIQGRCTKKWTFAPVAYADPPALCASVLRKVLERRGIEIAGTVRPIAPSERLPERLRTRKLAATHTTPLRDVLSRIGKNSQNLFAECLMKRLGAWTASTTHQTQAPGSWETGRAAIMRFVQSTGQNTTHLAVVDGSGLSRENRCTARQLAELMAWMDKRPTAELFRESLAAAGVDGSLRSRLRNKQGRMHGKTGYMTGVRTLTGYIATDEGHAYAFSILFNGFKGPSTPYKVIQDQFCELLIRTADGG